MNILRDNYKLFFNIIDEDEVLIYISHLLQVLLGGAHCSQTIVDGANEFSSGDRILKDAVWADHPQVLAKVAGVRWMHKTGRCGVLWEAYVQQWGVSAVMNIYYVTHLML